MSSNKIKRKIICTDENIKKISKENMQLWEEYKDDMYLRKADKAENTLKNYKSSIFAFLIWLSDNYGENKTIVEIDHRIVKRYLSYCQLELGNRGKRRNNKTSAISSLLNYLVREDYIQFNPLTNKLVRADIEGENIIEHTFLTEDQFFEMRKKVDEIKNERKRLQMKCFIELAFSTAARVGALVQFNESNLDLENRLFKNIREKGAKIRDLTFSKEAKIAIEDWLKFKRENNIDDDNIFITIYNGEYGGASISTLQDWSLKMGDLIGVYMHVHSFRKSYANIMKNKGVPIEVIQEHLGHNSADTTSRFYLKKDVSKNQAILDKYEI